MATHSSIVAWEIPRTEEPSGLQSVGLQRVRCNLVTKQQQEQIYLQDHLLLSFTPNIQCDAGCVRTGILRVQSLGQQHHVGTR